VFKAQKKAEHILPIVDHVLYRIGSPPHFPVCRMGRIFDRATVAMHRSVYRHRAPTIISTEQPPEHGHAFVALMTAAAVAKQDKGSGLARRRRAPGNSGDRRSGAIHAEGPLDGTIDANLLIHPLHHCRSTLLVKNIANAVNSTKADCRGGAKRVKIKIGRDRYERQITLRNRSTRHIRGMET